MTIIMIVGCTICFLLGVYLGFRRAIISGGRSGALKWYVDEEIGSKRWSWINGVDALNRLEYERGQSNLQAEKIKGLKGELSKVNEKLISSRCDCGNPGMGFDCVCDWVKKYPGSVEFDCNFCGIYNASKPRCNECNAW